MQLPALLPVPQILERLLLIFPPGLEMRQNLIREMTAKSLWVFLYGGMVEGGAALLRPSHIYFFTEEQAARCSDVERFQWLKQVNAPGFRPQGVRWYADTTREPIRDETIRFGLMHVGAVDKVAGVATTSSKPIYYLRADFAALLDPSLAGDALAQAISAWQARHLTKAARARMAMLAAGKVRRAEEVLVACPDGSVAKLSPGPSSLISKAVVEDFARLFLPMPALLWLSESGAKVRYQDAKVAQALGLQIDEALVLPDIILVNVGATGEQTQLVFVEVVASDGAMTQARREALLGYVRASGFPPSQCLFGTAFEDRADGAFKKCLPQLAWGGFVWFRTEPERLVWLHESAFDLTA